jgi:hypothetical protein
MLTIASPKEVGKEFRRVGKDAIKSKRRNQKALKSDMKKYFGV